MRILDKAVGRVLEKIKSDSAYEYNNIITPDRMAALRDKYTRSVLINGVWYSGNDLELKQLYERDLKAFKIGQVTSEELNYFWAQPTSGTNIRKIHSGIPQLISEKFVDLILSNGYEFNVYKDNKFEEEDEDNKTRLELILDDNMFMGILQEAIETESWSGGVAIKLSTNARFKYPIIEIIQPEEYEPIIVAGRVVEDIFIKYFDRKNMSFKLKEHYGVDDKGGFIKYKLYKLIGRGDGATWLEADLSELEETKDLKDISFNGIFEKFSIYKPNKLPNSEFRGSRLGESDYSGSHGLFDALDEVISAMVQEFRDGKIKNFWPSNLLPTDPLDNNKTYLPPALKKDFIVYTSGIGEKEQPDKVEQVQGDIHSEKYLESYKKLLETIVNNAGLSPQTLGVTGLDSTAASEESQELREKTSIRTREKKVSLWTIALNKLFNLLLILDDYKNEQTIGEYYIDVVFNDYKIQTIQDKTAIAGTGITNKTWDILSAVQYIHDELPEEQQILMAVKIKIENGMNVFTKQEEAIYKQFVEEVMEENPVVNEPIREFEETETIEDTEVIEE
ncbi:MAG: phage portal protein [Acholeplasmataceae bacterium]